MKPNVHAAVAANPKPIGSPPTCCVTARTTGTTMFALAVFEVVSDTATARRQKMNKLNHPHQGGRAA